MTAIGPRPYSEASLYGAMVANGANSRTLPLTTQARIIAALDAAHDSRLGLDASARVGDVLDKVAAILASLRDSQDSRLAEVYYNVSRAGSIDVDAQAAGVVAVLDAFAGQVLSSIRSEFEAT